MYLSYYVYSLRPHTNYYSRLLAYFEPYRLIFNFSYSNISMNVIPFIRLSSFDDLRRCGCGILGFFPATLQYL